MSRMMCKCGTILGTSNSPSPNNLAIYYEKEVIKAIKENPNITLNDFLTSWDEPNECEKEYMLRKEPVEYWYCTECQRVYEVQKHVGGHWLRVFKRDDSKLKYIEENKCSSIFVWSEMDTDAATEKVFNIKLRDFISEQNKKKFYITEDEEAVFVVDTLQENHSYSYVLEEA